MIAYRVEEQRFGKVPREMRKLLDLLGKRAAEPVRHLKVGTVMVREYQGTLHEDIVVGRLLLAGQDLSSLSTIAQAITGTSWNGPRFFGQRGGSSPEWSAVIITGISPPPGSSGRSHVCRRAGARRKFAAVCDSPSCIKTLVRGLTSHRALVGI